MNSCGVPYGTDSEQTYARQAGLCGGKSALHSALLPRVARELPPAGGHFREGAFVGEPQVPATFERSAPAGSNSLAFPGSGVGLPGREIPPWRDQ